MQNVSEAWKENQKQHLVSESFVEISLNVGDPDAQADAKASDNGHEFYSNIAGTTIDRQHELIKYATLEPGLWVLDGTCRILGAEDILPTPPVVFYDGFIPAGQTEGMITADWNAFLCKREEL